MPEQEASGSHSPTASPTVTLPAGDSSPTISGIPECSNTLTQRERNGEDRPTVKEEKNEQFDQSRVCVGFSVN